MYMYTYIINNSDYFKNSWYFPICFKIPTFVVKKVVSERQLR